MVNAKQIKINNQKSVKSSTKGFTLMELLIVIGVLAILATTATLVLNPAELLRQSRDSTRISDLATLNNALALYVTNVSSPSMGNSNNCYTHTAEVAVNCGARHPSRTLSAVTTSAKYGVDGTGWIPVNLGNIPGGSPLSVLPIDPVDTATGGLNNRGLFYTYAHATSTPTYVLTANFESIKYGSTGENYAGRDGGPDDEIYEIGSEPGLNI